MNRETMKSMLDCMLEELRELPDGTGMTTRRLLVLCGYDDVLKMDDYDLIDVDCALHKAAKKAHFLLDSSDSDDTLIGLPQNIPFVVRNSNAQIKCPRCGSTDTARILYRSPVFSKKLQDRVNAGKIRIGGCVISENDPERYCNRCRRSFGAPAWSTKENGAEHFTNIVTGVEFSRNCYFHFQNVSVKKSKTGITVMAQSNYGESMVDREYEISRKKWDAFVDTLYHDLYLSDWNPRTRSDLCFLDGEHWNLTIRLTGGRKRTYSGENAYPPYWDELLKLLKPFLKPKKRRKSCVKK